MGGVCIFYSTPLAETLMLVNLPIVHKNTLALNVVLIYIERVRYHKVAEVEVTHRRLLLRSNVDKKHLSIGGHVWFPDVSLAQKSCTNSVICDLCTQPYYTFPRNSAPCMAQWHIQFFGGPETPFPPCPGNNMEIWSVCPRHLHLQLLETSPQTSPGYAPACSDLR